MKHITIGVAGHIDHGKTALVRALTGTETDRLKEEQERGMTIVLGFAHLALPGGEVDFIDVPGHEKFVKTMIAGATGIDAALLVVAANERIKPQTVEHIALMGLLGIKRGIVAVTKSDLVPDEDERMLTVAELDEFLSGTFLRDAPLIFVSALTGEGVDTLQEALGNLLAQAEAPNEQAHFALPIDRAFTITGQGTIVTGTLRHGSIQVGQMVEILPRGLRTEVRGLQVHGQAVNAAHPGWRTAVNLRGIKKDDLRHGDTLATVGVLRPTRIIDADLSLLASADKPLKRGQVVVLHHGTGEVQARVYPLVQPEIVPGEQAFVQMRLSEDTSIGAGEPFIVRAISPVETIGGGRIIDPYPLKHTRVDAGILRQVQVLACGAPSEQFLVKLLEAGPAGRDPMQLSLDLAISEEIWRELSSVVNCSPTLVLHGDVFDILTAQIIGVVQQFHAKHPTRRGMPSEELRRRLPPTLKPAAYTALLQTATLETIGGRVRTAGYSPEAALSLIEREIVREIEEQFRSGGMKPPELDVVLGKDRRRKTLYYYLVESGALVPATDRLSSRTVVFHQGAIEAIEPALRSALEESDGLRVSDLNQVLGTTRKFSVPLLEYLDSIGMTRRDGDLRFWNGKSDELD
ncbi:MAG: selenocysteine-specific translation elongation factor [Janthinobacterium lividum]